MASLQIKVEACRSFSGIRMNLDVKPRLVILHGLFVQPRKWRRFNVKQRTFEMIFIDPFFDLRYQLIFPVGGYGDLDRLGDHGSFLVHGD